MSESEIPRGSDVWGDCIRGWLAMGHSLRTTWSPGSGWRRALLRFGLALWWDIGLFEHEDLGGDVFLPSPAGRGSGPPIG